MLTFARPPHQDHGDVRRVHEANRIAATSARAMPWARGSSMRVDSTYATIRKIATVPISAISGFRRLDHDLFDPTARELAPGIMLQVVDRLRDRAGRHRPAGL